LVTATTPNTLVAAVAAGATFGLARPAFATQGNPGSGEAPFGPVIVANSWGRSSYARAVRLTAAQPAGQSQTLLATFQGGGGPGFPLYRSDDDGRTWQKQSSVRSGEKHPRFREHQAPPRLFVSCDFGNVLRCRLP
jgi:hypothetical protein